MLLILGPAPALWEPEPKLTTLVFQVYVEDQQPWHKAIISAPFICSSVIVNIVALPLMSWPHIFSLLVVFYKNYVSALEKMRKTKRGSDATSGLRKNRKARKTESVVSDRLYGDPNEDVWTGLSDEQK